MIETERLIVRPWVEGDEEGAKAVYCDPEVRFFTGGIHPPETMDEFVRQRIEHHARGELRLLPLIEKSSGDIVGSCGFQPFDGGPEIEIGWMLARAWWGKGYATEMSRAVLKYGLEEMKLARILASIDPRNIRSIAVVNRLGMRYWRMLHVYGRDMLMYQATMGDFKT